MEVLDRIDRALPCGEDDRDRPGVLDACCSEYLSEEKTT